jgi:histidine ammonia-lyase
MYGCNTAFGAQASRVFVAASSGEAAAQRLDRARALSTGIAFMDVSVGPLFDKDVVRAAMLIRINMLMHGVSGVRLEDLDIYRRLLNRQVTPLVNHYGGIGASGDLAHNCRILHAACQLPGVAVWDRQGRVREAREVLAEEGIPRLDLEPKAGLGLCNGDNFSTALASLLAVDTLHALLSANTISAMAVEVLRGSDRTFHPLLCAVRPHPGQEEVARIHRHLLAGSGLAYQEMTGHRPRRHGARVQDGYSLRAIAQYHGVNFEKLSSILHTIATNANAASDNPLWVAPEYAVPGEQPWQWVSGGNFLAMYMVEAMDSLRKIMTQIVKLNDRHLARLVSPHENDGLPSNLSDGSAITQCAFKGVQIQSGMFEVYSSLLSIPVSTFFGIHEEGNQDITAHALTSGILALENLRLVHYSLAQHLLAIAQGVDLRGGAAKLAPRTQPIYTFVRELAPYVCEEKPLHAEIERLYQAIKSGDLMRVIRRCLEGC